MNRPDWPTGLPQNFGGLEEAHASLTRARAVVLPVPYDFSTTYQPGTRWGPQAILAASRNMELWDDEIGPTYRAGIHTLAELEPTARGPEAMAERVEQAVAWILEQDQLPVVLGGEHSITAGAVRAVSRRHAALSVAIRSMSEEEAEHLRKHPVPLWSVRQFRALERRWDPILEALSGEVYVTFDLDGLDPSLLPATGTPEPGGLDWYEAVDLLRAVSERSRIVGFDVVELAPIPGQVASDFLAARLVYRLIGLAHASVAAAARRA